MSRARNIKPGFFKNEDLAECTFEARLCFIGLWVLADRDGRLEDRPKRIKGELFAFDCVEVEPLLQQLQQHGFILRYDADGVRAIQILKFAQHQRPHYTESSYGIKPPPLPEFAPHDEHIKPENSAATPPIKAAPRPKNSGIAPPSRGGKTAMNHESCFMNDESCFMNDEGTVKKDGVEESALSRARNSAAVSAGSACKAMRDAGLPDVNPSHPKLAALLAGGMTVEELRDAAAHAVERGKGFAYALATAEGRRRDAVGPPLPTRMAASGALSVSGAQTLANASRLRDRLFPEAKEAAYAA